VLARRENAKGFSVIWIESALNDRQWLVAYARRIIVIIILPSTPLLCMHAFCVSASNLVAISNSPWVLLHDLNTIRCHPDL
jgi:hypothetical protein